MNAAQLHQMQEVAQLSFGEEFPHEYLMNDLYKADVATFFEVLNLRLLNKFNMSNCYNIYNSGGTDIERTKKLEGMTNKEKDAFFENEDLELQKVGFGNLMRPHFSEQGELLGFEIRSELIAMMLFNNDLNHDVMKRAVRTVCNLNKMIQEGINEDFNLMIGMESQVNFLKLKKVDAEIQVDTKELKKFGMGTVLTPNSLVQKMFKDHLLKILNRPFAEKKENLNKITIKDLDE